MQKRQLQNFSLLRKIFLKVARVVNLKLVFYGLIFLYFGSSNQVMQNAIPKLRQRSIISRRPGFFVRKIKNFDDLQLPYVLTFFAEILQTFST